MLHLKCALGLFVILHDVCVCVCVFIQNIELKVEVESLKKELVDKQELLKKAMYVIPYRDCRLLMQLLVTYSS